jgi:hypothetical protein
LLSVPGFVTLFVSAFAVQKAAPKQVFFIFINLGLTPKVTNILPQRGCNFANAVAEASLVKLLILLCLVRLIVVKVCHTFVSAVAVQKDVPKRIIHFFNCHGLTPTATNILPLRGYLLLHICFCRCIYAMR